MFNFYNKNTTTEKTLPCANAVDSFLGYVENINEMVSSQINDSFIIGKELMANPFNPKRKDEKEQWAEYMKARKLDTMDKNQHKICRNSAKAEKAIVAYIDANKAIKHKSIEMTTRNALKQFDLEGKELPEVTKEVSTLNEDVAKWFKTMCKKHGYDSHQFFDQMTTVFEDEKVDKEIYDATCEYHREVA